jgi:hypothetical protein
MIDYKFCVCVYVTEEQIQKHSILCEEAIRKNQPQKMVDNTASIARYGCPHAHMHPCAYALSTDEASSVLIVTRI